MPYAPKFFLDDGEPAPGWVESEFHAITSGIYPAEAIEDLERDGYDPIIIGNSHDFPWDFPKLIGSAFGGTLPERLKVGAEMMPQQLGWYQEFLRDAKEYAASKTIRGQTPSEETVGKLRGYLRALSGSHRGFLQCIDAGMDILPLEHPSFQKWIEEDRATSIMDEGAWSESLPWIALQPGFTSIRREIHSLGVIERERPHVIIVGTYHALKYDLLLGRDGSRTWIYSTEPVRWDLTLRMWREVHALYRKHVSRLA